MRMWGLRFRFEGLVLGVGTCRSRMRVQRLGLVVGLLGLDFEVFGSKP